MTRKRKSYDAKDKIRILKKHLVDGVPVSDVCDEFGLSPSMFYRWQKKLFEEGYLAFERPKSTGSSQESRVDGLRAKIAKKDEVISELMEEYIALKKTVGDR